MKISLVWTGDSRRGSAGEETHIGAFKDDQLHGCRSYDFLTHGVIAAQKFFEGFEIETILCVDQHGEIPLEVWDKWECAKLTGQLQQLHVAPFDRSKYRFNDQLYIQALKRATGEFVVKVDQDVALFRHPNSNIVEQYLRWLDNGFAYVCQPHNGGDMMWHASTRFFICKRETLDFPEIERCLDQNYVNRKYGTGWWCPCLEHILGVQQQGKVLYPPLQPDDYLIWSWVKYYRGILPKLNAMTYEQVRDYILDCGIHGPMDVIAKPL